MKRIAVDMDEVIADFGSKHLQLYNERFSEHVSLDDLVGKRLWTHHSHRAREILNMLDESSFFRDLDVIEGSQGVLRELSDHYEIFIATAAMDRPSSFSDKYEWLKEHFPFLPDSNFVFCGNKSIIHADYLIDDSVRHFKGFAGQGILYTAPHNLTEQGYARVNNWQEVHDYFL